MKSVHPFKKTSTSANILNITLILTLKTMQSLTFPYAGIHCIKTCKKELLIPNFARVNVSFKKFSFKLRQKNLTITMEAGIQNKHSQKGN